MTILGQGSEYGRNLNLDDSFLHTWGLHWVSVLHWTPASCLTHPATVSTSAVMFPFHRWGEGTLKTVRRFLNDELTGHTQWTDVRARICAEVCYKMCAMQTELDPRCLCFWETAQDPSALHRVRKLPRRRTSHSGGGSGARLNLFYILWEKEGAYSGYNLRSHFLSSESLKSAMNVIYKLMWNKQQAEQVLLACPTNVQRLCGNALYHL